MNKFISHALSKEGQVLANANYLGFPTTISLQPRTCVPLGGQEERACSLLLGRTVATASSAFNISEYIMSENACGAEELLIAPKVLSLAA
jgi:hypothetical protein